MLDNGEDNLGGAGMEGRWCAACPINVGGHNEISVWDMHVDVESHKCPRLRRFLN